MESEALLIPHTHLRLDLAALLLAAFERLYLLQPTEAPPKGAFKELVAQGQVALLSPPPLGDKLPWFERLIASYEEWGNMMRWPENVSLFRARPEVLEESVSEIKAAILGKPERREDPLLKARVILQLAQNLDQRLEELDFEYNFLKEQAGKLSSFILGNDPTVKRFESWMTNLVEPSWELSNLRERLLAWARLFLEIESHPNILVSDQIEVLEELLELAPEAQKMGSVSLSSASSLKSQEKLRELREKTKRLLKGIPLREETPPCLEIWRFEASPKALMKRLLRKDSPLEGGHFYFGLLKHA